MPGTSATAHGTHAHTAHTGMRARASPGRQACARWSSSAPNHFSGRRRGGAALASSSDASLVSLQHGVRPDEWRHSLDASNTALLNTVLPLAGDLMKHVVAPTAERQLRLSHLGGALCVGPQQLPWLWQLQCEASALLLGSHCRVPALYLRNVPGANAYTLAFRGHAPAVVLHTDTLETLNADEVRAVLAHELGHIACEHGVWLNVARLVSMPFSGGAPGGGPLPAVVGSTLSRWSRAAELSCDRAALLVARHPDVVVSALMKLVGGSPKIASQLNLAAFRAQAASLVGRDSPGSDREGLMDWFVDAAASALVPHNSIHDLMGAAATSFGQDHPSAVARAAEVDRWAGSPQFRALLARMPLQL